VLNDEFRSIYVVSGQFWKIGVAGLSILFAAGFTIASWLEWSGVGDLNGWVTVATVITPLGAVAFASWAIRCPTCDARWIWIAVSERDYGEWLSWALGLEFCPRCGYGSRAGTAVESEAKDAVSASSES
jgi:hypothetical protein